ncbi:TolB family protein [Bacillus sp. Marseille-P3661]|uniref:TolB family protein n=1 Tax=Bacillus sp. Marseille-P3661 TaxID=1936234 RepID=UPI000C849197|nr:PD40 domain-containing protein [Bacillus sp. Marseille-P3661]
MQRLFCLVLALVIFSPVTTLAANVQTLKAAYIRDGDLWTLINNEEKQITNSGNIYSKPKWSPNGKWLLYQNMAPSQFEDSQQQVEVWAYNIDSGEKKQLFYDGYSPTWAPNKNIVAFNAKGILNISDFKQFYNIATGVDSYTWLPDGSGFLLSSAGVLRPDGWTSAMLFKKKVNENYNDVVLFGGVEPFFTLPREIGIDNNKIISVYVNDLKFSPSNKWISFIVSPTASWSMDSNMLCLISSDGKHFEVLDEIVFEVGEPKWAPSADTLAFIAGGGRIVFGFKNKDLKVREMPVSGSLTPPNFADLDFDWINDKSIVTSRLEEREWSNDFKDHPIPSLFSVNIDDNKQVRLTNPADGYGDYHPQYVKSINKLVWLRGSSIIDSDRTLWKANTDGSDAEAWIKNVETIVFYE